MCAYTAQHHRVSGHVGYMQHLSQALLVRDVLMTCLPTPTHICHTSKCTVKSLWPPFPPLTTATQRGALCGVPLEWLHDHIFVFCIRIGEVNWRASLPKSYRDVAQEYAIGLQATITVQFLKPTVGQRVINMQSYIVDNKSCSTI